MTTTTENFPFRDCSCVKSVNKHFPYTGRFPSIAFFYTTHYDLWKWYITAVEGKRKQSAKAWNMKGKCMKRVKTRQKSRWIIFLIYIVWALRLIYQRLFRFHFSFSPDFIVLRTRKQHREAEKNIIKMKMKLRTSHTPISTERCSALLVSLHSHYYFPSLRLHLCTHLGRFAIAQYMCNVIAYFVCKMRTAYSATCAVERVFYHLLG